MLYAFSKVLQGIFEPGNLLLILLAIGVWRLATSRRRRGLGLVVFVFVVGALIAIVPIADLPLVPLEGQFPILRKLPDKIDGVILLGGAVDPGLTAEYNQVALNSAAARITEVLRLARHYPTARIVLSGGNASLLHQSTTEAQATARLLEQLGVPSDRLLLENRSRTTHQNAVFSKQLVDPQPGQVWILVTSAYHMPRAVGCFRRIGWPVVPDPVDFEAAMSLDISFAEGLTALNKAEHEWLGLVGYYVAGWTSALLPHA